MNNTKILSKISAEVKMPKKMYIGDPMYFEKFEGKKLSKLTYANNYRGKSEWFGLLSIIEKEGSFEIEGKTHTYKDIEIMISFAPNKKLLNIYDEEKCMNYQREKTTPIGVDTARYVIGIDDKEIEINTQADGFWGVVCQYFNVSKLEGIFVVLNTGEYNDLEQVKLDLEYLFDIKFA